MRGDLEQLVGPSEELVRHRDDVQRGHAVASHVVPEGSRALLPTPEKLYLADPLCGRGRDRERQLDVEPPAVATVRDEVRVERIAVDRILRIRRNVACEPLIGGRNVRALDSVEEVPDADRGFPAVRAGHVADTGIWSRRRSMPGGGPDHELATLVSDPASAGGQEILEYVPAPERQVEFSVQRVSRFRATRRKRHRLIADIGRRDQRSRRDLGPIRSLEPPCLVAQIVGDAQRRILGISVRDRARTRVEDVFLAVDQETDLRQSAGEDHIVVMQAQEDRGSSEQLVGGVPGVVRTNDQVVGVAVVRGPIEHARKRVGMVPQQSFHVDFFAVIRPRGLNGSLKINDCGTAAADVRESDAAGAAHHLADDLRDRIPAVQCVIPGDAGDEHGVVRHQQRDIREEHNRYDIVRARDVMDGDRLL